MILANADGMHSSASAGLFDHGMVMINRTLELRPRTAASIVAAATAATVEDSEMGTRTCVERNETLDQTRSAHEALETTEHHDRQ
jgi:hypothetical protein